MVTCEGGCAGRETGLAARAFERKPVFPLAAPAAGMESGSGLNAASC